MEGVVQRGQVFHDNKQLLGHLMTSWCPNLSTRGDGCYWFSMLGPLFNDIGSTVRAKAVNACSAPWVQMGAVRLTLASGARRTGEGII